MPIEKYSSFLEITLTSKKGLFLFSWYAVVCVCKTVLCIVFNKSVKQLFPSNENLKDDSVLNVCISDSHSEELSEHQLLHKLIY